MAINLASLEGVVPTPVLWSPDGPSDFPVGGSLVKVKQTVLRVSRAAALYYEYRTDAK